MEQENIIWNEMSNVSFHNSPTSIEPSQMDTYPSLYEELKDKCNPQRYMSPYDKLKVDIANGLYHKLLETNEYDNVTIRYIREEAVQQLGIIISTKKLYKQLLKYCNPDKFMKPYHFDIVQVANTYYPLVEEYKNDICKLEELRDTIYKNELLKQYYENKKKEIKDINELKKKGVVFFIIASITLFPCPFLLSDVGTSLETSLETPIKFAISLIPVSLYITSIRYIYLSVKEEEKLSK